MASTQRRNPSGAPSQTSETMICPTWNSGLLLNVTVCASMAVTGESSPAGRTTVSGSMTVSSSSGIVTFTFNDDDASAPPRVIALASYVTTPSCGAAPVKVHVAPSVV